MRNFSRFVASPVRMSDAAVREEILRSETKLTLRYATAGKAALREHVAVTPDEAKALVAKQPDRVRGLYQQRLSEFQQARAGPRAAHPVHGRRRRGARARGARADRRGRVVRGARQEALRRRRDAR